MPTTEEIVSWRGQTMYDRNGDKIGSVEEIYLDQETERPKWALVNTGLFGSKSTFVPIADAAPSEDGVRVPFEKDRIKDAPNIDAQGELSQQQEQELYRHYGMDYGEGRSESGLPEGQSGEVRDRESDALGRDVSGPTTDEAMTRSEEELRVGKTQREAGRARLRKYVVTDQVTQTVPVQREEVTLEREDITDANVGDATSGPGISEEEHEVTLMEEEVVVEKRAVPKERVSLGKEAVTEEREVSEEVRKEEVELVDADGAPERGLDGERGTDEGVDRR